MQATKSTGQGTSPKKVAESQESPMFARSGSSSLGGKTGQQILVFFAQHFNKITKEGKTLIKEILQACKFVCLSLSG